MRIIYKYHGGPHRGAWPHIPARDLTEADIERIKQDERVDISEIDRSGLYEKISLSPKKNEVKDG